MPDQPAASNDYGALDPTTGDGHADPSVQATPPAPPVAAAPPSVPLPPPPNLNPFILTIGDIGITPSEVVTPNGTAPLAGSQWICTDMTSTQSKIPAWAIIMAIIGALLCLVGLLFLLVKEEVTTGYVEVSVRAGSVYHKTQIPVSNQQQISQIRQQVGNAQILASQADQQAP